MASFTCVLAFLGPCVTFICRLLVFNVWTPIMLHLNLVLIYCLLLFMKHPIIYFRFHFALFFSFFFLEGCAASDGFATIPFHLVLFSAALVELAKSIPVHSLILSFHRFFSLPLHLFPFIVLCRIVFAKPEDLQMWQKPPSFLFLDQGQEFIIFSSGCLDPFANFLIGNIWSL